MQRTEWKNRYFLSAFPEADEKYFDLELEKKWEDLFILRNEVNKALEIKRAEKFLGNSLEAKISTPSS